MIGHFLLLSDDLIFPGCLVIISALLPLLWTTPVNRTIVVSLSRK